MPSRISMIAGHLKTVLTHKYWVFRYSLMAGIPLQGFLHDFSKFSPAEWFESIQYYTGLHSPIRDARAANQFSWTWLHHRGRNRHHFEYWIDNTADGNLTSVPMPFPWALEMICDRLGAARAYRKERFTVAEQVTRLDRDINPSPLVHPQTKRFVQKIFTALSEAPDKTAFREVFRNARQYYDEAWKETFEAPPDPPKTIEVRPLLISKDTDALLLPHKGRRKI